MAEALTGEVNKTPLYDKHVAAGGRMVEFGGYMLPVQYPDGIVAEHNHTRNSASLFDVSHMGQIVLVAHDHAAAVKALETVTPADLASLAPGEMRYTVLLNRDGGIEDDLIITRPVAGQAEDGVMLMVVNAARKHHDLRYMQETLEGAARIEMRPDLALIALQGPLAAEVLGQHTDIVEKLGFMQAAPTTIGGIEAVVSRSGYTGEDGFELSIGHADAEALFDLLVSDARVKPAGLGARDSLRLEAGLCLYGHDMDDRTDPVSASLVFAIGKNRRTEGGFFGAEAILKKIAEGTENKRVGIKFEGRQPVREGADLVDVHGNVIGKVTSGTFGPTIQAPIAMGYMPTDASSVGSPVTALVRGKPISGAVVKMPFVQNHYVRKP
ncbi:glycine cleavage system aminomethyltransferase GcvT [Pelagibacterium halotolerans]|uniref:glycine cleavage system aminomethyltransferase GcvT n=1 Tax=Pelagibacterium halotolerans TaxID=531813 RepID=UPI00384A775C